MSELLGKADFESSLNDFISITNKLSSGKLGVITSSFISYQSCHPSKPLFLSSTAFLPSANMVLQEICLPAWAKNFPHVFK